VRQPEEGTGEKVAEKELDPERVGNLRDARAAPAARPSPAIPDQEKKAAWEDWEYRVMTLGSGRRYPGPDQTEVVIDGIQLTAELDNGAPTALMSEVQFLRHWKASRLTSRF
jgi:hypothetical protein